MSFGKKSLSTLVVLFMANGSLADEFGSGVVTTRECLSSALQQVSGNAQKEVIGNPKPNTWYSDISAPKDYREVISIYASFTETANPDFVNVTSLSFLEMGDFVQVDNTRSRYETYLDVSMDLTESFDGGVNIDIESQRGSPKTDYKTVLQDLHSRLYCPVLLS